MSKMIPISQAVATIRAVARKTIARGSSHYDLFTKQEKQALEMGAISLEKHGPDFPPASAPSTVTHFGIGGVGDLRELVDRWRRNADMLAEGNKSEGPSDGAGMQRACADQLAETLDAIERPDPEAADAVAALSTEQLADIFEDMRVADARRKRWQALSEEDRYIAFSMAMDLAVERAELREALAVEQRDHELTRRRQQADEKIITRLQAEAESHGDWRAWLCFMFTDNSKETQALADADLRRLICENLDREGEAQRATERLTEFERLERP